MIEDDETETREGGEGPDCGVPQNGTEEIRNRVTGRK